MSKTMLLSRRVSTRQLREMLHSSDNGRVVRGSTTYRIKHRKVTDGVHMVTLVPVFDDVGRDGQGTSSYRK